ncbi:hypothetical protein RB623_16060 [Mesorhizobium sp. LHD-90]|uniref:hypothetical protein n=1 Tax=Mesorhizobium sp. LHD-90 TaxID=3071414 RepID=UPI0027DF3CAB|nr:hypothetical protein [Mesorhizobium sp. LHD-90]MDQ6435573.1 hypothetical protein [Mesorhizobium sp. LHD-90]
MNGDPVISMASPAIGTIKFNTTISLKAEGVIAILKIPSSPLAGEEDRCSESLLSIVRKQRWHGDTPQERF